MRLALELPHRQNGAYPRSQIIVQTTIDMTKGVETEVQMVFLQNNGHPIYQGYLCIRPVPVEKFERMLSGE